MRFMKKNICRTLAVSMVLFLLTACGSPENPQPQEASQSPVQSGTQQEPAQDPQSAEETGAQTADAGSVQTQTADAESTQTQTASEETAPEEPALSPDNGGDVDQSDFGEGRQSGVENNGGYFLRVDDEIYYRVCGENLLDRHAIEGDFLHTPNIYDELPPQERDFGSHIERLNLDTLEQEEFTVDYGYGPLYSDGKGLYLNEHDGTYQYVVYQPLDGSETQLIGQGMILGCSAYQDLLAVEYYATDPYAYCITLYQGKEPVIEYRTEDTIQFVGLTSEGIFFLWTDYSEGTSSLYQLTLDDHEPLWIGNFETFEYGFPTVEQFLPAADGVYVCISAREGSASMVAGAQIGKAIPGEEGSLTPVEIPDRFVDTYGETSLPELYLDEAGRFQMADIAPGKALLGASAYEGGDLMYTFEPDEYTILKEGYRTGGKDAIDGTAIEWVQQTAEVVDGAIYLIAAQCYRAPEFDIGWREVYASYAMEYIRIALPGGEDLLLNRHQYEDLAKG